MLTDIKPQRFDWMVTLCSAWMVFGVFLDGWGHHHGATESFFTPWHYALYSGFVALASTLFGATLIRRRAGRRPSYPPGYRLSVAGAAVFFVGGFADGVWHTVFGIEHKVEAFISPPHMTLFVSGVMTVLGPLSALRYRKLGAQGWRGRTSAVLALAFALGLAQFATEHANALLIPAPAGEQLPYAGPLGPNGFMPFETGVGWGLSAVIVQSVMVACILVVLVGRMQPPRGAVTLILLIGVGHSLVIHSALWELLAVLAAGVVGDVVAARVARGRTAPWVLTATVPAVLTASWIAVLAVQFPIIWTIHLLTGAVATAAVSGTVIGFVAADGRVRPSRATASDRSAQNLDATASGPEPSTTVPAGAPVSGTPA